jgi:hypothetical protein
MRLVPARREEVFAGLYAVVAVAVALVLCWGTPDAKADIAEAAIVGIILLGMVRRLRGASQPVQAAAPGDVDESSARTALRVATEYPSILFLLAVGGFFSVFLASCAAGFGLAQLVLNLWYLRQFRRVERDRGWVLLRRVEPFRLIDTRRPVFLYRSAVG